MRSGVGQKRGTEKRRKRGESVRKETRRLAVLEKRKCGASDADDCGAPATRDQLQTIVAAVQGSEEALKQLRVLLCAPDPDITALIEFGAVSHLCAILQANPGPVYVYEAAWCLTNMASGVGHDNDQIIAAAPMLITYLQDNSNIPMQIQCAWALGNLAADSRPCREALCSGGAIAPLIAGLNTGSGSPKLVSTSAWALSNLARGAQGCDPLPPWR
jgi:hypothetical protein